MAAVAPLHADARGRDYLPGPLRIATGGTGGVYHVYGQGIAAVVRDGLRGVTPAVVVTGASVDNLRLVAAGEVEVAFALADSAAAAAAGSAPFDSRLPITALARLYENYLHLVVAADGPVRDLADLAQRRVSLGANGSGTEVLAGRVLDAVGLDRRGMAAVQLGVEESAAALAAGALDAFFFSAGLPVAAITDLAREMPIRLLGLGDHASGLRETYGEYYAERTIPTSAYDLGRAVPTVGVPNYLVVSSSMAAPLAYALTRLLFTRQPVLAAVHPEARRLNRGAAIGTYPLPLHPGAARYYRDVKS